MSLDRTIDKIELFLYNNTITCKRVDQDVKQFTSSTKWQIYSHGVGGKQHRGSKLMLILKVITSYILESNLTISQHFQIISISLQLSYRTLKSMLTNRFRYTCNQKFNLNKFASLQNSKLDYSPTLLAKSI